MLHPSLISLLLAAVGWRGARAKYTPYLVQSFFFEWDTRQVPVPAIAQCDILHVSWSRSVATGPNPVSPYFLQIYSSAFPTSFIISAGDTLNIDWPVPFPPDSVFQVCMFDKNGNTGGCQRTMTVIPASTANPTCQNVTFPPTPLDVTGTVANGPFSQYGWIPQCTDLELKPNNGTPPYTYTFAPQLHPPYNITSNSQDSVNWTVPLSWASQFFVSVVDSAGNSWARGPLHSGSSLGSDPPTCLLQVATTVPSNNPTKSKVSSGLALGAGVGGGLGGLFLGLAIAYLFMRDRVKSARDETALYEKATPSTSRYTALPPSSPPPERISSLHDRTLVGPTLGNGNYNVEPFVMPNEDGTHRGVSYASPSEEAQSEPGSQPMAGTSADRSQHVYVVHHDGGRAPVTVFTPDGTEVVELPPRYIGSEGASEAGREAVRAQSTSAESAGGRPGSSSGLGLSNVTLEDSLNPRRRAGPKPTKPRGRLLTPPTGAGPGGSP